MLLSQGEGGAYGTAADCYSLGTGHYIVVLHHNDMKLSAADRLSFVVTVGFLSIQPTLGALLFVVLSARFPEFTVDSVGGWDDGLDSYHLHYFPPPILTLNCFSKLMKPIFFLLS